MGVPEAEISVGTQYAAVSPGRRHDVLCPWSEASVENAFVVAFPRNVWSCESPGWPGKTIGSSVLRWLKPQPLTKLTIFSCESLVAFLPLALGPICLTWANARPVVCGPTGEPLP